MSLANKLHVFAARSNPLRWQQPQKVYNEWVDHILDSGAQLTVAEVAYGELPWVCNLPGVNHIPLRAKTWCWSKENVLNLAIQRVPEAQYICWSDTDVFHRRKHWASETVHALQHYDVVQPWSDAYDLGPNDEHIQHHISFCRQFHQGKPLVPMGANWWKFNNGPYDYPHCLTGDNLVIPGGRVHAASSRAYEGDIIVFRTAAGHEVSCTFNHPVLTEGGWVPAASLNVGDHVFSQRAGHNVSVKSDKQDIPARIEDVVRAFGDRPGVSRTTTPARPEHFHGDGGGSKVAVIWTDRLLRRALEAEFAEEAEKQALRLRHNMQALALNGLGSQALLCETLDLPFSADTAALSSALLSLFGRGVGEHSGRHGAADLGASLGGILSPAQLVGLGGRAQNSAFLQPAVGDGRIHADDPSSLRAGLAGKIELDEVVYIGIRKFSGHVYNLNTEHGYIVADGVVTHNSGYIWAVTRQVLDWLGGLFDLGGMGSGDHHMALALASLGERSLPGGCSQSYKNAVLRWQDRAGRHVNGNIGYVPGTIEHRFHGRKADRGYLSRWDMFIKHGFDPETDLKRNSWGVYEWAGNKPGLRREFDLYLRSRQEDSNTLT